MVKSDSEGAQTDGPKVGKQWKGLQVCGIYPLSSDAATSLVICSGSVVDFEGDAIVNAANEGCITGGGVDGAITDAGGPELAEARRNLPVLDTKRTRCPTGDAKLTVGGRLKAQYCIHAVGPNYTIQVDLKKKSMEECDALVTKAYSSAMECARDKALRSVAFSLISSSIFRGSQTLEAVLASGIKGIQGGVYPELQEVALVAFTHEERSTLEALCGEILSNAPSNLGSSSQPPDDNSTQENGHQKPSTTLDGKIQQEPAQQPLQEVSTPDAQT
mmetsp:Transcript_68106/g.134402  ORF Transcript_68106/g.134402 Transcript_68106/m.134402 type:complete len:274 (-) Transcript_68106:149-970(-)